MAEGQAKVAIVMGSQSDWPTMKRAAEVLAELGVDSLDELIDQTVPKLTLLKMHAYSAGCVQIPAQSKPLH